MRGKREKSATSTWVEGTRDINPKPSKVEDKSDRNQSKGKAVVGIKPLQPLYYLTLPQREILGNAIWDNW